MRHRSSRHRYRGFVQDYKARRLDEAAEAARDGKPRKQGDIASQNGEPSDKEARSGDAAQNGEQQNGEQQNGEEESSPKSKAKRRQYLREYLRWLWPHRYAVAAVFLFALMAAGLQM